MIGFRAMFAGMSHNQVPGADVPGADLTGDYVPGSEVPAVVPENGTKPILKIE